MEMLEEIKEKIELIKDLYSENKDYIVIVLCVLLSLGWIF
jgi:predicted negative regulator of RcsB-dependent stress response